MGKSRQGSNFGTCGKTKIKFLAMPQSIYNPFSGQHEEVVFKDTDGRLKKVRGGQVIDLGGDVPIPKSAPAQTAAPNYDHVIDTIVSDLNLGINDEVLLKRLRNLILSHLKGIRNDIEVREVLSRPTKVGGLGLDETQAQQALETMKQGALHAEEIPQESPESQKEKTPVLHKEPIPEKSVKVPSQKSLPPPPPPPPPPKPEPKPEPPKVEAPKPEPKHEEPKVETPKPSEPKHEPKPIEQKHEAPQAKPEPPKATLRHAQGEPSSPEKTPIENAQSASAPVLTGPVEELKDLTIVDFKRLDPDPVAATNKIYEKIQLLGRESFEQKFLGISAWRQSEIFRTYTEIGAKSLETKKAVKEVIEQMKAQRQPVLNEDEFVAIMDLNQKLRY